LGRGRRSPMEIDACVDAMAWQVQLSIAEASDPTHLRIDDTGDESTGNGRVDCITACS